MLSRYFKNKKDQTDFFISIAVIAIAGIFISYYSFNSSSAFISYNNDITNPKVESLELEGRTFVAMKTEAKVSHVLARKRHEGDEFVSASPIVLDTMTQKTVDATKETFEEIDEDDFSDDIEEDVDETDEDIELDEEGDFLDEAEPADLDAVDLEPKEEINDEEINDEEINDEEINDLKDEDEVDGFEEDESIAKDVEKAEDAVEAVPEYTKPDKRVNQPKNSNCIIVIGAFGNKRNIKRLIGKLDYQGYPIFKVPYNGLTRVGVYANCDQVNETLIKIQKKYSKGAFVMKAR